VEQALLRRSGDDEGADRFQMLSGPAMAKGVEDRAFYDYTRFVALNEVGGDADAFGLTGDDWHLACAHAAEHAPRQMLTTATHDTKRGEDVRARLAAISEDPGWWSETASKWMARHDAIDGPTEYLLLQTLVGAWPLSIDRVEAYMQKAAREAGTHTSWAAPDEAYERAVSAEVRACLDEHEVVDALVERLQAAGERNALAQTLLRLTAPGVPDTYQGTEFADFSLVDPDNRRPVDFSAAPSRKTRVVAVALGARREFPAAFTGAYEPLETEDAHTLAYRRGDDVVVVVPLRTGASMRVSLPAGQWTDRLPDAPVSLLCR
jgi:(1->4)-alpha-D-glucan 1-alpha-D-glucosylmutase